MGTAMDATTAAVVPHLVSATPEADVADSIGAAFSKTVEASREARDRGRELLVKRPNTRSVMDELSDEEFRDALVAVSPWSFLQLLDARVEVGGRSFNVGVVR